MSRDGEGRLAAVSVAGLVAALTALAVVRGPLIYDGSFFLYQVLQTGAPFIPDNRVVAVPLHLLVIGMGRLTDDTWTIALGFSVLYIALAAGAYLGSAWWLRRQAPRLAAWPLLGLVAVSPILIDSTTESLVTGGLAFPLVHLAASPKTPRRVAGAAVLSLLLLASHPAAGVVLVLSGAVAAYRWLRPGRRDHVELAFAGLAVTAGVLRMRLLVPGYETQVADPATFVITVSHGITAEVALMVLSVWLVGAGLLLYRLGRRQARGARWLPALPLAGAVPLLAGLLSGHQWPAPLDFRLAVVPALIPLLLMQSIDTVRRDVVAQSSTVLYRRATAVAMLAASLGMGIQAARWSGEVGTMRAYIAAAPGPCLADVSGGNLAISSWGGRSLAVIVQGRRPRTVFGSAAECRLLVGQHVYSGSNHFVALYPSRSGWFQLPAP